MILKLHPSETFALAAGVTVGVIIWLRPGWLPPIITKGKPGKNEPDNVLHIERTKAS